MSQRDTSVDIRAHSLGQLQTFDKEVMEPSFGALVAEAGERGILPEHFGMMVVAQAMPCIRASTDNNEAMLAKGLNMVTAFYERLCQHGDGVGAIPDVAGMDETVEAAYQACGATPAGMISLINGLSARLAATSMKAVDDMNQRKP